MTRLSTQFPVHISSSAWKASIDSTGSRRLRIHWRSDRASWTSVDAAGRPILPLLVRVDETNAGEVKHALCITLRGSVMARFFVWSARHQTGQSGQIPFGALLGLRADFVIPGSWTTQAKAIVTTMKRYGVYVADNGSDM